MEDENVDWRYHRQVPALHCAKSGIVQLTT
jgi:hypothetical protein